MKIHIWRAIFGIGWMTVGLLGGEQMIAVALGGAACLGNSLQLNGPPGEDAEA